MAIIYSSDATIGATHSSIDELLTPRDVWRSLKRGFLGHCPKCGKGKMFRAYLKVDDRCGACGEELHHQRADDAPPYFTILVVAHIVGAGILGLEEASDAVPMWVHALIWPALTIGLSLTLLPRFKGALVGLQWANRMHGFGTTPTTPLPSQG